MDSSDFESRFGGIARLYGTQAMGKIRQARILVIGIGGVGSWVAEALARTGLGHMTLVDLDDVCVTNINRQIHAVNYTVGKFKVDVMKDRIATINPYCEVDTKQFFFSPKNLASIFDKELLLDDMQLYKNLNFSKSDLYTIKNSIKKFMEEMIFNFHKKIDDLSELEYLYYLYGDPYVYFLKDGGRKNALSDRIYWYGIFKFFENYNDIIYTECECPYCLGSGYTQDIKYYLIDGKSIFDVN